MEKTAELCAQHGYKFYFEPFPPLNPFLKKRIEIAGHSLFILKYQVDYLGGCNPRLATDINGWVDWSWNSLDLTRFIDAFGSPYPGASTYINEKRVRLKQVHYLALIDWQNTIACFALKKN